MVSNTILNPDKGTENFIAAGLNSSNTVMYNKDYYQNIDQIKQKFSDAEGNFDQEAFDQYYDSAVRTYNKFVNNDLNNKMLEKTIGVYLVLKEKDKENCLFLELLKLQIQN